MKNSMVPSPGSFKVLSGSFQISSVLASQLSDPQLSILEEDNEGLQFSTLSDTDERAVGPAEESYVLDISQDEIEISASGRKGFFNGILTLSQLYLREGPELNCCRIEDTPLFNNRAVMLDISRNRVYRMEYLKEMIRKFALLKFNQLQLYMENTFDYRGHETACRDSSPLTPDDIRELDTFCRERGIELVPNQNSFGHMERWLRHPEYHGIAEAPDGFIDPEGVFRPESSTLYPGTDKSMDFIRGLYDQLLPCFTSRRINIGCDETWDLGKGRSREAVEKAGVGRVYLEFVNRLINEAEGRGYSVQLWADIILNHPELLSELAGEVTAVNWGYEPDHPFEKETTVLKKSGLDFYVCTGTSSWNAPAARWEAAYENIRNGAFWAEKNGASGYMVTDWGDNGHWNQPAASWPGFLMAAQGAWGGADSMSADQAVAALDLFLYKNSAASKAHRILGSLYLENSHVLHNGSVFTYMMMDPFYPYYRGEYGACRKAGTGKAQELIERVGVLLAEAALEGDYPHRQELELMHGFCRFSVNLTEGIFRTGGSEWQGLVAGERRALAEELRELSERFAAVWELSCRPGGLADSLEKLKSWLERLES